jgi:hypothetical protein
MKQLLLVPILLLLLAIPAIAGDALPNSKIQQKFVGQWVRTDGGYVIHVREVRPDGSVDAGYFNPKPINVSEANVSVWKGFDQLFIKLEDKGYPGSTYKLYYYAEKDQLAGFYYQAAVKETFEVLFRRK